MSVSSPAPAASAELNDRELDILRLLAAGHTVKSIAAHLGRSEASINERLRDARRKTGIGSSRELARMVASQKVWDRNFDLPKPDATSDPDLPPESPRRIRSKGPVIMLTTLAVAALGLTFAGAGGLHPATAPLHVSGVAPIRASLMGSPLAGRWSLDVARIPANERPRSVTIAFRQAPDRKWTTQVDIVAPDGSAQHAESTASADGQPVAVTGTMDALDTVSLRQPAPGTLVMTLGKNGTPVSTRVYTVAKDRRSMTETIIWASTALPKLETTTFRRID